MEKLQKLFCRIIHVHPDYKLLIPRLVVGLVFLSEGIQKYIMPEVVGAGRFERIGFEHFEFLAYFVGTFEILCGIPHRLLHDHAIDFPYHLRCR